MISTMKKSMLLFLIIIGAVESIAQQPPLEASKKRGSAIYMATCGSCHMPTGEGLEGVFPPLAKTNYLKDQKRAIGIVLNGQEGEITVNGVKYDSHMAGFDHLKDQEIADVLNFVSNSWGNKNPVITPAQVKAGRKK